MMQCLSGTVQSTKSVGQSVPGRELVKLGGGPDACRSLPAYMAVVLFDHVVAVTSDAQKSVPIAHQHAPPLVFE